MEPVKKFPNVYTERHGRRTRFFTKGNVKESFFDEFVLAKPDGFYREIDPMRSKLFAAIAKDISQIGVKEESIVLYLGASHGYTVSFLSDMVAKGFIFALDFAPRVVRDMVFIAEKRANIAPMLADANQPDTFKEFLPSEGVDVVFMDIAQKNQVEIFTKNCHQFLKPGGFGLLALKSRSIDVTKKPALLFREVRVALEKEFVVVDYRELYPFEKDHAFYVVKKK
jgi:fibrillarin-like pre-rRNA processing protein